MLYAKKEIMKLLKEVDIDWLKRAYFSDPARTLALKEGEVLLRPNKLNRRLFLILEGTLVGYIENETGEPYEIFRSSAGQFVGVYSYFSPTHRSYSTVVADGDSRLAYIDEEQKVVEDEDGRSFAEHFLPVIVHEIYLRQLFAQQISIENQATLRKLYRAESLAMLGQMAAGLAHELNNAVGVIKRNAEFIADRADEFIRNNEREGLYHYFRKGLDEGQSQSSADLRRLRRELERRFDLPVPAARKLAMAGVTPEELTARTDDLTRLAERIDYYFETGLVVHDMLLAAAQASSVVRSVNELGATNRELVLPTDVNQTLREALALLRKPLEGISLQLDLAENMPTLPVNPGELIQMWVNLIKNAAEALRDDLPPEPQIMLRTREVRAYVVIQVIDNGPGIPGELLPKIFQPNVTTKVEGLSFGLGLGLAIVKRLVAKYQGQIEVDSRPGRTAFTVQLPVDPEPLIS